MEIVIDWPRAEQVCGQLLTALRNNEYPYTETWALPQTFIPESIQKDPLLHARFLFYCCHYMRGTIKSDLAVKRLIVLCKGRPEFFDPFAAQEADLFGELKAHLGEYIGYRNEQISGFWQENSRRLALHFEGDPRVLLRNVKTSADLYRRVMSKARPERDEERGFLGFQKKMASMLAYFLMDADLVSPFTASPPVDFHLIRIMLATGILVVHKDGWERARYEHLEPRGVEVMERYCHEHGVSLVELGNALWMLSVVLCSKAPGNMSSGRKKGKHGKAVVPVPLAVSWDNPRHVRLYSGSCGRCPLENECSLNVMSGAYYQSGELLERERLRPTRLQMHPLFVGVALPVAPRVRLALNSVQDYVFVPEPEQDLLFGASDLPVIRRRDMEF